MAVASLAFSGLNAKQGSTFMGRTKVPYYADQNGIFQNVSTTDGPDFVTAGYTPTQASDVLNNLGATVDPTTSNDQTQGYSAGSNWFNTTNGRLWINLSSATGAATWALAVVPGTGVEPSSNLEQFGAGTATMLSEGNVYRNTVAGANPGGTGSDYVLASYTLPANSFDIAGRGINFVGMGSVANNTNVKRMKIYYGCTTATVGSAVTGGTVIADSGAYSTTGAAGWQIEANVFKYGANGSNTQLGLHLTAQVGATVSTLLSPTALTATENAAIIVAITGNATTTATDITYNFFEVNAMN